MSNQRRYCVECGAAARMVDRPPETDICAFCEHGHPADVVQHPLSLPRLVQMRGVYNDLKAIAEADASPGQGRGR